MRYSTNKILLAINILLITLPVIAGLVLSDPANIWSGLYFNPQDGNSYFAKMYEGWRGDWRFTLPYTSEPGEGGYLFLFYISIGHISRISSISIPLTYHLFRIISAIILFLSLSQLYSRVFRNEKEKNMALVLACFGSGAGWMLFFVGYVPTNFWVAEAFPFLSGFANPHFPLGLSLLLIAFSRFSKTTFNRTDHLIFFILGLLISIIMPFGIVIGCLVIGIEILMELFYRQRKRITISIAFFLGGVPFLLYQFLISTSDPILSIWNEQNNTPSPPIWDLLISLSPILLIAIWGLIKFIRSPKKEDLVENAGLRLLLIWFVIGIILVYFPFSLQRRFMFGLFVPICGIGIWGFSYLRSSLKSVVWKLTFSLSVISTVLTLVLSVLGIYQRDPLLFLSDEEMEAVQWINSNTSQDAVILASPHLSMFIPAQTGRRVIYGHPFETINARQEIDSVDEFFNDSWGREQASRWLSEKSVQYIVFDAPEGKWGVHPFPDCSVSFDGKVVICTPGELW